MYGEICYTQAILTRLNFRELDFFWYHCTRRELLYTYQIWKVTKQTRGKQYTIFNFKILMVFRSKCIGHACSSWHFAMDKGITNVHKPLDMVENIGVNYTSSNHIRPSARNHKS